MADRLQQKLGDSRVRLVVLLGVLAVLVVIVGVRLWSGRSLVGGSARSGEIEYVARNLPALEIGDLERGGGEAAGSGGNPFAFRAPPTPTPNLTPPPTPIPRPTKPPQATRAPRVAMGADGQPKPPPPPFNREFIGYFGPAPFLVAAFRNAGEEPGSSQIDVAVVGEVLDDIFIVREIGLESVLIGFVGYDPSEDSRVPLSEK
jgi:hypothetical protein